MIEGKKQQSVRKFEMIVLLSFKRYVMYFANHKGSSIYAVTAPHPTGPFSQEAFRVLNQSQVQCQGSQLAV